MLKKNKLTQLQLLQNESHGYIFMPYVIVFTSLCHALLLCTQLKYFEM